ncbi:phage terminase large subunit-like protein [Rhizobium halophytocola]|uniref:Phage terminase large subunit-like protein n=2 Tax=Rhizobium halophytocola TaxID=735519 RepID=A0ABS4E5L9_9HYPH|nr:phage terminase large subunit-like protein [Rhizobium halophytocola]
MAAIRQFERQLAGHIDRFQRGIMQFSKTRDMALRDLGGGRTLAAAMETGMAATGAASGFEDAVKAHGGGPAGEDPAGRAAADGAGSRDGNTGGAGEVTAGVDDRASADTADAAPGNRGDGEARAPGGAVAALTAGMADGVAKGMADEVAKGMADGVPGSAARPKGRTIHRILDEWPFQAREEQMPPKGDWRHWLLIGGRGSGKTRAGAEWVQAMASRGARSDLRIALVAETLGDAREVMIDGVSGICRVAGRHAPDVEISRRRLVWPNGAMAQMFSSEDPESLRGPQFHLAWCDEIAKWKYAEDTFDMLQFGLRLGALPRIVATTTPRPVPLLKRLLADPATVTTRLTTQSNAQNLSPGFIAAMQARYGATRLGRQELMGELIEDREDGLWRRAQLEHARIRAPGPMGRIVVGVDPPAGAGAGSVCGIVVAGLEAGGRAVVLDDASVAGASPAEWANAVMRAYRRFEADRVVAEVNQGGEMVAAVLRSVKADLPLTLVRATRGKYLRAEPVAALYEQGRVAHAGRFAALEDQMCDFGPDGLSGGRSPDRLDALCWALTTLMLDARGEPRVRGV